MQNSLYMFNLFTSSVVLVKEVFKIICLVLYVYFERSITWWFQKHRPTLRRIHMPMTLVSLQHQYETNNIKESTEYYVLQILESGRCHDGLNQQLKPCHSLR
jgi:hypothetical protein